MPSQTEEPVVRPEAIRAAAWFLENALDANVALQEGKLVWVNHTWTRLTGWRSDQSIGRPYADFVAREDAGAVVADLAALEPRSRGVFTCRIAAKSQGLRWMRHHVVQGDDGSVLMILRDITAEHQREIDNEQARRVAGMVRSTAGVTPWRYDAEEDRYEIDPDFTDHVLRRVADLRPGPDQRAVIHPDDLPAVMQRWDRAVATGEAGGAEYRLRMGDGAWRRMRGAWQGLRLRPCGRWDVLGVSADVTEIADARDAAVRGERAARAAAEAKSQFLANISHEIRTPMNGVLGLLHLIRSDPPSGERRRLVDQALAAGVALSGLLNDIIDFSDVEVGRLELAAEPVDPTAQLASVVAMFRAEAEAKDLGLEVVAPADVGWVVGDGARLRKLFFHLVGNAVKFTHQGRIEARLTAQGEGEARRLRLEVEDTGVGVAPDLVEGLFAPFTQADGAITRRYGGPGLGLAVTKRLAELMGGSVGFSSRPGEGSTFWVEVAAPAGAAPSGTGDDSGARWLDGVNVLVVEDNPINRLVASRLLGELGARVTTAENGAEGVAAVERSDYDLVFMDIQMPVMDGVEAARRIRAMPRPKGQVPIVATTANVLPEQLAAYRSSGIDGVVAKPISPAALLSEVARIAGAEAG